MILYYSIQNGRYKFAKLQNGWQNSKWPPKRRKIKRKRPNVVAWPTLSEGAKRKIRMHSLQTYLKYTNGFGLNGMRDIEYTPGGMAITNPKNKTS